MSTQERDKSQLKGASDSVCLTGQSSILWKALGLLLIDDTSVTSYFCPLQTPAVSQFSLFLKRLPTRFLEQSELTWSYLHMILCSGKFVEIVNSEKRKNKIISSSVSKRLYEELKRKFLIGSFAIV